MLVVQFGFSRLFQSYLFIYKVRFYNKKVSDILQIETIGSKFSMEQKVNGVAINAKWPPDPAIHRPINTEFIMAIQSFI